MSSHWVFILGFAHSITNALLDYTGCSLLNFVNNTDDEWEDSLARQKKWWCVIFPVLRVTPLTLLYPHALLARKSIAVGPVHVKKKTKVMTDVESSEMKWAIFQCEVRNCGFVFQPCLQAITQPLWALQISVGSFKFHYVSLLGLQVCGNIT